MYFKICMRCILRYTYMMYFKICVVSLQLVNGMVQYRFDCGSGEGLVTVPNLVSDGEWHIIMVERHGNKAEIFLDGQYSAITVAPGINDELNLHSTDVYFGAEVEMYTNGYVDVRKGFHGCMEDIRIYNVRLPVSGSNAVALSQQFEKVEFSCKDDDFSIIGNSKFRFLYPTSNTYSIYPIYWDTLTHYHTCHKI